MTSIKQAIVLRTDIGMSTGKLVSQACHASLKAFRKAETDLKEGWLKGGEKKVVLEAGDNSLEKMFKQAEETGISSALVEDAGLTEVEPGTVTALGVGPAEESKIDTVTGELVLIE